MPYQAKRYDHLIGLPGFSETMLKNHFTLYEGYVKNVDTLSETLEKMRAEDKMKTPEYSELKRRLGWEFNGMRLHELYFQNINKDTAGATPSELAPFVDEFKTIGMMRGIGWVVMYYDPVGQQIFNAWINEHDVGHFTGCLPLLVMDVFEHAYMTDYGLKRADYIETFMKAIDWVVVSARLTQAKSFTP